MEVLFGKGRLRKLRLRQATIGAADDCTLQVLAPAGAGSSSSDPVDVDEVARHHARIEQISGRFVIRDLGSAAGTFVGGNRVGSEPQALAPGQVVKLGRAEFTVVAFSEGLVEIDSQDEFVLREPEADAGGAGLQSLSAQELRTYDRVASALEGLHTAREPSSEHLSVLALGEWAAGERPHSFLATVLEDKASHLATCDACRAAVEYFRERASRRATTGTRSAGK